MYSMENIVNNIVLAFYGTIVAKLIVVVIS